MDDMPFEKDLELIKSMVPSHLQKPRIGIVCGSGLSTLASSMRDKHEIPYATLHGFGENTDGGSQPFFQYILLIELSVGLL